MHVSIMLNWGAAGNVIGYNYSANDFDESAYNVSWAIFPCTARTQCSILSRRHIATSFQSDGIWGSNSHNNIVQKLA